MSDIPDKVISDAVKVVPATQAGVGSARMVRQVVTRAAPVIAAWAARQERVRIGRALNEADAALAAADDDERAYWEGHVHALVSILNQEGEQ